MDNKIMSFLSENIVPSYKATNVLINLDEAESVHISDDLIAKLYKNAVEKYDYLDFGNIPDSKGDITRLKDYQTITDTISLLSSIQERSGMGRFEDFETVKLSFQNLHAFKKEFTVGFIQDKKVVEMLYNTIVTSVICGLNIIISTTIEYIRTPGEEIQVVLNKVKSSNKVEYILIDNLKKFNTTATDGSLHKFFSNIIKVENFLGLSVVGAGAVMAVAAIGSAIAIVPLMRELVFYAYNVRMKVSEYLRIQAEFVDMNTNSLKFNDAKKVNNNDKKKIISKQEQISNNLKKWSDKFRVKFDTADKVTRKELIDNKIKIEDMGQSDNEFGGLLV